jgi:hypothetical protein
MCSGLAPGCAGTPPPLAFRHLSLPCFNNVSYRNYVITVRYVSERMAVPIARADVRDRRGICERRAEPHGRCLGQTVGGISGNASRKLVAFQALPDCPQPTHT